MMDQDVAPAGVRLIERSIPQAAIRGALCRCPNCGEGRMFGAYLKVVDACEACGEELHHHRADDAPPYVVMSIIGHIIIAGVLSMEVAWHPEIWVHLVLWMPLTVILSLLLLPPVKGALVGVQWALRMHGFGGEPDATTEPNHPAMQRAA
jgi:uncharacterized protein (DUF983 family)